MMQGRDLSVVGPRSPQAISIPPSPIWIGDDGHWNAFVIGVGTPIQWMQLLISTASTLPWVFSVDVGASDETLAYSPYAPPEDEMFNSSASLTWVDQKIYSLPEKGDPLTSGLGDFGLDTFVIDLQGLQLSVPSHLIAGIRSQDLDAGIWGIRPSSTNLGGPNDANFFPPILSALKNESHIRSLAWGFTAGAYQRNSTASLTFGGYDASGFEAHSKTFALDPNADLLVSIQSIDVSVGGGPSRDMLQAASDAFLTFLDTSTSFIWLPELVCDNIAAALNLTYNTTLDLYIIEDSVRESLMVEGANITFVLANNLVDTSQIVNITLPYSAFDLQLTPQYFITSTNTTLLTNSYYFPIKRAANSNQYILGRTFFQEAYVIADYERSEFSVHQALFPGDSAQNLQAILPLYNTSTTSNSTTHANTSSSALPAPSDAQSAPEMNVKIIVPAVLGIVATVFGLALGWVWIRKLRRLNRSNVDSQTIAELCAEHFGSCSELSGVDREKPQLHGEALKGELDATKSVQELRAGEVAEEIDTVQRPKSLL